MVKSTLSGNKKAAVFVRTTSLSRKYGWFPAGQGYEVRLLDRADQLPASEWKKLNRSHNLFTSLPYLSVMEKTAPAEMSFVYGLLRFRGRIIAGYIFQIIHLTAETCALVLAPLMQKNSIVGGLGEWLTRCREEKGMRILISGNNFISGEHGVIYSEESAEKTAFTLLPAIAKRIVSSKTDPVKISLILAKDYYSGHDQRPEEVLNKKGYYSFAVEPEMIVALNPDWVQFDDYVAAMSKKYRNRAKSVCKKSGELSVANLSEAEIFACRNEIFALYVSMHSRARFRLAALTPEYFSEMKKAFPEHFSIHVYRQNGNIVAFRSGFVNQQEYEAHFIGVDYSVNKIIPLYQRILYDFVADAISSRSIRLLLGRTAAEIKSTVGAVPAELVCYMRHRNRISNHVIAPFVEYLKPSAWVQRNPFRSDE